MPHSAITQIDRNTFSHTSAFYLTFTLEEQLGVSSPNGTLACRLEEPGTVQPTFQSVDELLYVLSYSRPN